MRITHNLRMLRGLFLLALACAVQAQSPDASDWGYYGGDAFGQRYSSLAEIDRHNVEKLAVAWQFRTGELGEGFESASTLGFAATPLVAFGLLYLSTPTDIVVALDPATGRQRWRYDPRVDRKRSYAEATSRGVSIWEDRDVKRTGPCRRRVFIGTLDGRLIALNAGTGTPCTDFGSGGVVGLGGEAVTSPPTLYDSLVIVGSRNGPVRAFDARTGASQWTFPAAGAANVEAVMSVDEDRGMVFVPTAGADANSLVALEAKTGKRLWQHPLLHRDLWGFGIAAQPALVDLELNGTPIPAVLQATKSGMLFVFARHSGNPMFPIVEQRVPRSRQRTDRASPTQPFPVTPALVAQNPAEPLQAWGVTFWDRAKCRAKLKRYRNEGVYTPPDEQGAILWPGDLGGVNWGGIAFDARRQRVFAAVNHLPMLITLTAHGTSREGLLSPLGLPCTPPPWGTLVSVDMKKNEIVWQVPLGSTKGMGPWFAPARNFGTPNMGGPMVTAGDLVFVGAAMDSQFRAFDLETGRELWKYRLPAGGQATPMTYRAGQDHRQYVLIAAGGNGELGTPRGDYVIAFALPR